MTDWVLIPCLKELFAEFDHIAPGRDHASDGSIGNAAHEKEVSDHNPDETGRVPIHDADHINEVHAIDVDNTIRESDLTMEKVVQFLLGRCRSGAEKRLRYIIYDRRIWDYRSGWVQKTYTGPSPHTEHAHFSASYETKHEYDTSSWHLEDIPVSLTTADKKFVTDAITAAVTKTLNEIGFIPKDVLATPYGNRVYPNRVIAQHVNDLQDLRDLLVDPSAASKIELNPASALALLLSAARSQLRGEIHPPITTTENGENR